MNQGAISATERQRDVLAALEPAVRENLSLLASPAEAWQPTDYLPDLAAADWRESLAAFRETAAELSDEVLVVLVGDMVTEEALPSYAVALNHVALDNICRRIAGDEARHELFYTRMMAAVPDADPQGGVLSIGALLRRMIVMPGKLMYDGKDPDLFDHFAVVAQRLGVYGVADYARIVRHPVQTWAIADRALSGAAAKAQDFLCRHADRVEALAEPVAQRIAEEPKRRFSWIHDRQA